MTTAGLSVYALMFERIHIYGVLAVDRRKLFIKAIVPKAPLTLGFQGIPENPFFCDEELNLSI